MATLTQSSAGYVADETISLLMFDEFTQAAPVMPALYSQMGSSGYREVSGSFSGLDEFQAKTELANPTEDNPIQQFSKEFNHNEFALMSVIERKVIDDARFQFFGEYGRMLGQAAMRKMESLAAAPFNEAFSSTEYLAEDGLSICNSAHVNVDGGNSQDNAGSTALGYAAVGTTRNAMIAYTDYRGGEISVNPDLLIVPDGLEQTAWEIVRSSGDPSNANNISNFHNGRYGVVVWGYLRASDTNNWFMADSMLMKRNLKWYWRVPLENYGDGDLFKGTRRVGGYFRQSHGCVDWRWVYGHAVA